MKYVWSILIIFLFLVISVTAQSTPSQLLPTCVEHCINIERLGRDGHIFTYRQNPEAIIYNINTATSEVVEFQIDSYFARLQAKIDFAVIDNNRIIFVGDQLTNIELHLIDLQLQQSVILTHNIPSTLAPCGSIPGFGVFSTRYVFRYDDNHVLLCTIDTDRLAYANIVRIENDNLVYEERFQIGGYGDVVAYPPSWFSVLQGLNGQFYVVPTSNNSILNNVSPSSIGSIDSDTFAIMAYEPIGGIWSATIVDIPPSRPALVANSRVREVELIGVDQIGNNYFVERIRDNSYTIIASSVMKFTPAGQKLWEMTESDFGNVVFDTVIIIGDNHISIFFSDNSIYTVNNSTE